MQDDSVFKDPDGIALHHSVLRELRLSGSSAFVRASNNEDLPYYKAPSTVCLTAADLVKVLYLSVTNT